MTATQHSRATLFLYFVLAVMFLFGAIVSDRTSSLQFNLSSGSWRMLADLRWLFWLLLALAFFCLVPLFKHLLSIPVVRDRLPKPFASLLLGGIGLEGQTKPGIFIKGLYGRLFLAGVAIFGVVFVLSNSNAVREFEINSYVYEYLGGRILGEPHWPPSTQQISSSLRIDARGMSDSIYFRHVLKVVSDLKDVGAKAVMVDLRNVGGFLQNYEMLRQLEETGICVFGLSGWGAVNFDFSQLNTKDPRGPLNLSKAAMTIKPSELVTNPFVFRFLPEASLEGVRSLDITLELLRKYNGYPADLKAVRSGSTIVFGDYAIPLGRDDWGYSRQSILTWFNPTVSVVREDRGNMVRYKGRLAGKDTAGQVQLFSSRAFTGKIVFLERSDLEFLEPGWMYTASYRSLIQMMWEKNLISRSHSLHVWITLVCIALFGMVASRLNALPSMLVIFALGCTMLVGCWFAYYKLNVMIDIFSPLLAAVMSMFIFPVVRATEGR